MTPARRIVDDYADARFERHAHGLIFVDGREVAATLQCPHCGAHFISRRGSGHRRTWCFGCHAVTCGRRACDPCRPFVRDLGMAQGRMR